ncbi:MAG: hypothetical protein IKP47_00745 [Ruminococcus sp.]|nr:hypothetical protein [Ruminococcus sp.]
MKGIITAVYAVCIALILSVRAEAYIDPATTSYIIQIVAGVVIAVGTVFGIYWKKIRGKVKKKQEPDDLPPAEQGGVNDGEKDVITAEDLLDDEDK